MNSYKNKAVFFDRDGTIIEEKNYLVDINGVKIYDRVAEGLLELKKRGYKLFMVSNQSGVARGYMTIEDVQRINNEINRRLSQDKIMFDDMFFCPHYPTGIIKKYAVQCSCRKPEIGMALMASRIYDLDLNECFMVGDKQTDMNFGIRFKAKGNILVTTGYGGKATDLEGVDYVVDSIYEACRLVCENY